LLTAKKKSFDIFLIANNPCFWLGSALLPCYFLQDFLPLLTPLSWKTRESTIKVECDAVEKNEAFRAEMKRS
jgi:hypothetical protein